MVLFEQPYAFAAALAGWWLLGGPERRRDGLRALLSACRRRVQIGEIEVWDVDGKRLR